MDAFDVPYFRREFARLNERMDRIEAALDRIASSIELSTSTPTPPVEPIVRKLLRAGHKLQAAKAYQPTAGVGRSTAETFIDRWGDRIARATGDSEP